jgi:sensor histidine kinase YesM
MEKRTIAPMVLIPFVENAFKHGDKNHEPGIIIELRMVPGKIIFSVENFIRQTPPAIQEESGGFGLQNIKRRLRLLYPEKHFLLINKSDDKFKVELTILN